MTVDFSRFFATASELYGLWALLFSWMGGILVSALALLITATWWMRGYQADVKEAGLKGQIDILRQRLSLATEQQAAVSKVAKDLQTQASLQKENRTGAIDTQFKSDFEVALAKLMTANSA